MAYFTNKQAPQSGIANLLAMKGRMGDTELVHMSKPEINIMRTMGKLTTNPNTGLPEAFNLEAAMQGLSGLMMPETSGKEAMQELMNFGRNKIADYNADDDSEPTMAPDEMQGLSGVTPPQGMSMPPQMPLNQDNFQPTGRIAALAGGRRAFEGMLDVNNNNGDGMSDDIMFRV